MCSERFGEGWSREVQYTNQLNTVPQPKPKQLIMVIFQENSTKNNNLIQL